MSDIEKSVNEIIEDLKNKVNALAEAGKADDPETLKKINDIKQKAINVLNQASDKVVETARDIADSDEVQRGIDIVKSKSKELYDNALNKINELSSSDIVDDIKDNLNDMKEDVEEFLDKPEVKNAIETAKNVAEDIGDRAVNTLKEWLKPEGK